LQEFLSPERALATVTADYDCVLDCMIVLPKLNLIIAATARGEDNFVWEQVENS
jgi:hypothetical protein